MRRSVSQPDLNPIASSFAKWLKQQKANVLLINSYCLFVNSQSAHSLQSVDEKMKEQQFLFAELIQECHKNDIEIAFLAPIIHEKKDGIDCEVMYAKELCESFKFNSVYGCYHVIEGGAEHKKSAALSKIKIMNEYFSGKKIFLVDDFVEDVKDNLNGQSPSALCENNVQLLEAFITTTDRRDLGYFNANFCQSLADIKLPAAQFELSSSSRVVQGRKKCAIL